MANEKVIRYAKNLPIFSPKDAADFKKVGSFKVADVGSSVAKSNRNYHIANQVHYQLNRNEVLKANDDFSVEHKATGKHVDFPWGIFLLFVLIDILDIIFAITLVASPLWSVFLLAVVLPFQLWYIKNREKKYSEGGIDFNLTATQTAELKKYGAKIQRINREASALLKAGKIEEAAMTLGAAKRVLPKNLRFFLIVFEKIPWINFIPINSIMIIMSYYDNIATVKAMNAGVKLIASRMSFNTTRKYTNIATNRSGK